MTLSLDEPGLDLDLRDQLDARNPTALTGRRASGLAGESAAGFVVDWQIHPSLVIDAALK